MSTIYEHTQKAGLPFYSVLIMVLVVGVMICSTGIPSIGIILPTVFLLLWPLLMMSSLTVTIDHQFLRVRFGPGVFFKKFPLSEITACDSKYKTFICGWGIRYYFGGWLYNIAGFKSVEVIFKNSKKARIGTDEPEKLAAVIESALKRPSV
jgi:hypothetical protein